MNNFYKKTIRAKLPHLVQLIVLFFFATVSFAQLRADFSATPLSGCPPMVVSFTDNSTGNPVSWRWDLGNGTTSFLQNPIATYFTPGSYNIKLIVTNASGKDSIVKNKYIVVNDLPVVYFKASDTTGCFPLKVQFKDSSIAGSGNIVKWQWDFGDGTLSTEQNPSHTYTSPGTFNVILRVSNSSGCSGVLNKPAYITISAGMKAGFSILTVPGCQSPSPVTFVNESSGTGTLSYQWNFGDGKTSTASNPTNNYNAGLYTVKLIATSSMGCTDTIVKTDAVAVGLIHAQISSADTICEGTTLQFTNVSSPENYSSSQWDFGDGTASSQTNPGKTYSNPGTYKVKLIVFLDACKDSVVKTITVLPKPTAAFTASNASGCAQPLQVSFVNQSANATSYTWSFGDGGTSALKDPIYAYTQPGTYSVSLTVANAKGCATTVTKDNLVNFVPLKIETIKNLKIKGCLPITVSPVAIIKDNMPVASYQWDFGDGSTSTSATPSHTYSTPGMYDVKLLVTTAAGCTDTFTFKQAVDVGNKPSAKFTADVKDVCAKTAVNFTDLSTNGPVNKWQWFFGDAGTSNIQNPKYTYVDTGYFDVTLIVGNFGCEDTLKLQKFIYVRPPIAKFDTSYLCNDPLQRKFLDQSAGANSWNWNFGDGATSTASNPSHTYLKPGNYSVLLTVANGVCEDTLAKNVVVINEQGKLSVSDSVNCTNTPNIFNIKNIDKRNISKYSWYVNGFPGNAITTTTDSLVVRYSVSGSYSPVVILTDLLNCSDTAYSAITIKTYGPKAAFTSAAPNTCLGNTVAFSDSSKTDGIHPITQYLWSYGEGPSSSYTAGPFSHNYSTTGTYDVKLVVKDSYGCFDSIIKPGFVSITKPLAKFAVSDSSQCPSSPITFTNSSSGVALTYLWNFGDGTTSALSSPVHSFSATGAFKVTLLATDKNGCTSSDSTTIRVATAKASFAMSDTFSTCPPLVVNIKNNSSNYTTLNWDFGDGGNSQLANPSHIYTYPGKYTVKLTVRNGNACMDELIKQVVIEGPSGTFDYLPKEVCLAGKVDYRLTTKNAVKYIWDFSDGTTIFSVNPTASHTYVNAGFYQPKIILEDSFGCKVPVLGLDTIKVYSVNTNIVSNTKIVCDSGFVSFRDSTISNDGIKKVLWDFGDGTSSNVRNPTHNYTDTGFYSVKLITTTNFGCADTSFSKNYIKGVRKPLIKMIGDTSACEPAKLQLAAESIRIDTSTVRWAWNFGNGNTSVKQKPDSQMYSQSGSYNVTVKATNSDGCANTVTRTAVIHPKPPVDAGPDKVICRSDTYTLTATGADSYIWSTHPSLSCSNCTTPVAKPDSTMTYYVTGKTLFGCANQDSVKISVQQPFKVTVTKADAICKGETVAINASGADLYQWTPSLWLNNPKASSPKSTPDTSITYQVVGKDVNGCFQDTQSVRIKVNPIPSIDITNGQNITVPVGGSVKLNTKNSGDVINWKWIPSQWLNCASCAEPIAAPRDNITYSVVATNEWNCSATDKVTINLICDNTNVYIPNTFSPNGDGVNDVFYLRSSGALSISSFKVFNKWGNLVFQKNGGSANNSLDGWDGNSNGVALQADVYVYVVDVICSGNTTIPLKGNVTLVR